MDSTAWRKVTESEPEVGDAVLLYQSERSKYPVVGVRTGLRGADGVKSPTDTFYVPSATAPSKRYVCGAYRWAPIPERDGRW